MKLTLNFYRILLQIFGYNLAPTGEILILPVSVSDPVCHEVRTRRWHLVEATGHINLLPCTCKRQHAKPNYVVINVDDYELHEGQKAERIRPSMLRICKRVYSVCQDLIFKHNVVRLPPFQTIEKNELSALHDWTLDERVTALVQKLNIGQMEGNHTIKRPGHLKILLRYLASWPSLKSLTLSSFNESPHWEPAISMNILGFTNLFDSIVEANSATLHQPLDINQREYDNYLLAFQEATQEGGYLTHVDIRLEITRDTSYGSQIA
jgi:hypothetical protein